MSRVCVPSCPGSGPAPPGVIALQPDLTLSSALSGTPVIAAMLKGLTPRGLVLRCHPHSCHFFLLFYRFTPVCPVCVPAPRCLFTGIDCTRYRSRVCPGSHRCLFAGTCPGSPGVFLPVLYCTGYRYVLRDRFQTDRAHTQCTGTGTCCAIGFRQTARAHSARIRRARRSACASLLVPQQGPTAVGLHSRGWATWRPSLPRPRQL